MLDLNSNILMDNYFIVACKNNDVLIIKKLVNTVDSYIRNEGFRWACKNGHIDIVTYLVESSKDIDIKTKQEYCF